MAYERLSSYEPRSAPAYPPAALPFVMPPYRDKGIALLLELSIGFFFQTFGVGHLYAGRIATGLAWMLGYWALTAVNFVLCFVLVGFVTWPLTYLLATAISAAQVGRAVDEDNHRLRLGLPV